MPMQKTTITLDKLIFDILSVDDNDETVSITFAANDEEHMQTILRLIGEEFDDAAQDFG